MSVDIILRKPLEKLGLNKPLFIMGFPSTGLVGSIALTYLTTELNFDIAGTFKSDRFAPIAAIHSGKPLPPIRIMYSKEHNSIAIVSEMAIPVVATNDIVDIILKFFKKLNGTLAVSIGGVSLMEGENKVYYIPSNESVEKLAESKRIGERINEGATTGVTAVFLYNAFLRNINAISILAEANAEFGDPKASSNALKALYKLTGIKVNTSKLDKEAKELVNRVKEASISSKKPSSMYG